MLTSYNNLKAKLISKVKISKSKNAAWLCSCGYQVPKKDAILSGDPSFAYGFHVHCPICKKVVAKFVDPKEVR